MVDEIAESKVSGQELIDAGWKPGPAIGRALAAVKLLEGANGEVVRQQLAEVYADPDAFVNHSIWVDTAKALVLERKRASAPNPPALGPQRPYPVWGASLIDSG